MRAVATGQGRYAVFHIALQVFPEGLGVDAPEVPIGVIPLQRHVALCAAHTVYAALAALAQKGYNRINGAVLTGNPVPGIEHRQTLQIRAHLSLSLRQ